MVHQHHQPIVPWACMHKSIWNLNLFHYISSYHNRTCYAIFTDTSVVVTDAFSSDFGTTHLRRQSWLMCRLQLKVIQRPRSTLQKESRLEEQVCTGNNQIYPGSLGSIGMISNQTLHRMQHVSNNVLSRDKITKPQNSTLWCWWSVVVK